MKTENAESRAQVALLVCRETNASHQNAEWTKLALLTPISPTPLGTKNIKKHFFFNVTNCFAEKFLLNIALILYR